MNKTQCSDAWKKKFFKLARDVSNVGNDGLSEDILLQFSKRGERLERALKMFDPEQELEQLYITIGGFLKEIRGLRGLTVESSAYMAPKLAPETTGRPSFHISEEQLKSFIKLHFTVPEIAESLNVSESTVHRRLKKFNMTIRSFSVISDADLQKIVAPLIAMNKKIGMMSVWSHLSAQDIRVPRSRVQKCMRDLDQASIAARAMALPIQRRTYYAPCPNHIWHADGNHKLIHWRIVIHACIDGATRLVVFLSASNNNRSSTVLNLFASAVSNIGYPTLLRVDRGGENNRMCELQQLLSGKVIKGKSTHNQRVERFWCDNWRENTHIFHELFTRMEAIGLLLRDNDIHIWALHVVFLPLINANLKEFREAWNLHKIRTCNNQSPSKMFLKGMLKNYNSSLSAVERFFNGGTDDVVDVPVPDHLQEDMDALSSVQVPDTPIAVSGDAAQLMLNEIAEMDEPIDRYSHLVERITQLANED